MNDKLKRHIQDTINNLQLTIAQAEYLKSCMEIAYRIGRGEALDEAIEINKK